ncbi:hypothetical protein D9611_001326 [Ephemerocybe angulata]|uniref:F-box domain-containing protein n=1 Tax=Ephemerocybe angulata TaxID=980116 RepID=A0A8H5CK95_9AGAR|nr:hypothetical protein D9611_001326 [Tulosesus angulatus]
MDPSIFQVLSADVLSLIIAEIARNTNGKGPLCEMRLVSKAMSTLIEPKVFSTTKINFSRLHTPGQLRAIVAGDCPNNRWTTSLLIEYLVPAKSSSTSVGDDPGVRRSARRRELEGTMVVCQNELLIPAIRALRRVSSVCLNMQMGRPNDDVLRALSQLPQLISARVDFDWDWGHDDIPAIDQITNLRSLELDIPSSRQITIQKVAKTIASSPSLESLALRGFALRPGEDEDEELVLNRGIEYPPPPWYSESLDIVQILPSTVQRPMLKKLKIYDRNLKLSASCFPYFNALTELHVEEPQAAKYDIEPSFWKALSRERIELKSLRIYPLVPAAIAYLTSYTGLETLEIDTGRFDQETEKMCLKEEQTMARRLYRDVLPRHQATLQDLRMDYVSVMPWALEGEFFDYVLQCRNLRKLGLPVHYIGGSGFADIGVSTFITQILSHLLHLKHLYIGMLKDDREDWDWVPGYAEKVDESLRVNFAENVCEADITSIPVVDSFGVTIGGTWSVALDPILRRLCRIEKAR